MESRFGHATYARIRGDFTKGMSERRDIPSPVKRGQAESFLQNAMPDPNYLTLFYYRIV